MNRTQVFISYSHKDATWLERLQVHLKPLERERLIERWDDTRLKPGEAWREEIRKAVDAAKVAVLLISADFLASDFIAEDELPPLLVAAKQDDLVILPVIVSPSLFERTPLAQFQAVNPANQPVVDMGQGAQERVFADVADSILEIISKVTPEAISKRIRDAIEKPWNVPMQCNSFFTGREGILDHLEATLTTQGTTDLAQAITGLGGIGKTQTALEYACRHRGYYQAVLWVTADSKEDLVSGFVAIAVLLNLPAKDEQDQQLAVTAVKNWLATQSGWLLVLDNVDDPTQVKAFLPLNHHGHVLLTPRAQVFDFLGIENPLELEEMPPDEARMFLLKRTGRSNPSTTESEAIDLLAEELDYLPLALEQAGAFITRKQASFQNYLISYRKRGLQLLETTRPVIGEYPKSVITTWSLNFEQVKQTSPGATDLLMLSAFLSPDKIPLEILTLGSEELGSLLSDALAKVHEDPLVLDELLESLTQYSLIRRYLEQKAYDIHRLVQAVLKAGMDETTKSQWAERAVRAVNRVFPSPEFADWPLCNRLLPQALRCAALIEAWGVEFEGAARLLNDTAYYLYERARYEEAEPLYRRALAIFEKALGPEHPDVVTVKENYAFMLNETGRAMKRPLWKRLLDGLRRSLVAK